MSINFLTLTKLFPPDLSDLPFLIIVLLVFYSPIELMKLLTFVFLVKVVISLKKEKF